jgi:hypothetical protein
VVPKCVPLPPFSVIALTRQNKRCHKDGSRGLMVDIQDQMVLDNNHSTEADNRGITGGTSESFDESN